MEKKNNIKVKIFAYQNLFFEDDKISGINFKGLKEGELTLLSNHIPIISVLKDSLLKLTLQKGKVKKFKIKKGILYFSKNTAKIICNTIEILDKKK